MKPVVVITIIMVLAYLSIAAKVETTETVAVASATANPAGKQTINPKNTAATPAKRADFRQNPQYKRINAFVQKIYKNELKNCSPMGYLIDGNRFKVIYGSNASTYSIVVREMENSNGFQVIQVKVTKKLKNS